MRHYAIQCGSVLLVVGFHVLAAVSAVRDSSAWMHVTTASAERRYVGVQSADHPTTDFPEACCIKERRPGCGCWIPGKCFNEGEAECPVSPDWIELACIWAKADDDIPVEYPGCTLMSAYRKVNSCKIISSEPETCPEADPICPENYERPLRCKIVQRAWNSNEAPERHIVAYGGGTLCPPEHQPVHECD